MENNAKPVRDLKERTKDFALRIIRLYAALPRTTVAQIISKQLLRSGTSVGANFREALRARSKSEYGAKMSIGLMELEEALYWQELLEEGQVIRRERLARLKLETGELIAIFVTLIKQARYAQGR